jgi:hypothetical protein
VNTIYTAGYLAGWTPESLKTTCEELGALLLDIRYSPHSRRAGWDRAALRELLGAGGYQHDPALGNRNYKNGRPIELAAPERALVPVAKTLQQRPIVLLCACREAAACHRSDAAAFLAGRLGAEVVHLEPPSAPGTWKVLSLNPPYGSLIAACERFPELGKHIETRGHEIGHRGPLLIHQTKGLGEMFDDEAELIAFCNQEPFRTTLAAMGYRDASELPRGAIVAACELRDCRATPGYLAAGWEYNDGQVWRLTEQERALGNYAPGRYAYLLADIRALPEPIAARGMPGLWEWQGEIITDSRKSDSR